MNKKTLIILATLSGLTLVSYVFFSQLLSILELIGGASLVIFFYENLYMSTDRDTLFKRVFNKGE